MPKDVSVWDEDFDGAGAEETEIQQRVASTYFAQIKVRRALFDMTPLSGNIKANFPGVAVDKNKWATVQAQYRGQEWSFTVLNTKVNPNAQFDNEYNVRRGSADWNKTTASSIMAATGTKSVEEGIDLLIQHLKSGEVYAEYRAVEQQPRRDGKHLKPDGTSAYKTIEFVKFYWSREECLAAYRARYGSTLPTDVLQDARSLYDDVSGNVAKWERLVMRDPKLAPHWDELKETAKGWVATVGS